MRLLHLSILLGLVLVPSWGAGQRGTPSGRSERAQPIGLPRDLPVASYDFDIRIDPDKHRLAGRGTIDLPAVATDRDALELELREEFTLHVVTVESASGSVAGAKLSRLKRGDQFTWSVRPARAVRAGESVKLRISYGGGRAEAGRFLYIGPEVSFANASRESWLPRPVGVAVMGKLRFSVPAGLTVASMGSRTTTPDQERKGQFSFSARVPGEPWFAAGRYTVLERPGPIPAAVYVLKARAGMAAYVEGCIRIIEVLSGQFGGYPFGTFSLVELPAEITAQAGGFNALGSTGAILTQGGALDEPFNLAYFGHEIGHQWWGNIVSRDPSDGRGDYMMDEAMADLGSLLAVEVIEGEGAGERYRRSGYPGFNPDTYSTLGYLKFAAAGLDTPLSQLPDDEHSFRLARSKGGRIWYALSREIGPRFPEVMGAVVRRHAYRPVTWTAFLASINQAAGRNLDWFYTENFDRVGAPDWSVHTPKAGRGRVEVTVQQPAPGYRGRVPVELVARDGSRTARKIELAGVSTKAVFRTKSPVRSVLLDPRFTRLHWTPEFKAEANALEGYTRGRLAEGNAKKLEILRAALKDVPSPDIYAVRYQLEALIGTILALEGSWSDARVHLEAAIAEGRAPPDRLPLHYLRLATVAKALRDDGLLRRAVDGAIKSDAAVGNSSGAAERARELLAGGSK